MAHGDSRGEKAAPVRLKSPGEGRQSCLDNRRSSAATTWLSVLSACRDPTADAVGHILAPLMRLGVGRRAYSSAYGQGAVGGIVSERQLPPNQYCRKVLSD